MDNPTGRVVSLADGPDGVRATVRVAAASCPRCAAGKGCGAGLLPAGGAERRIEADIPEGLDVEVGDVVELVLAPANILRAALIVYGLPLCGAIGGASFAWGLGLDDGAAAALALLGLAVGLYAGRQRVSGARCMREFHPVVEAVR